MYDSQTSDTQLVMRWIPVVDPSGRTRMESCWISATQAAPAQVGIDHAA
jgi:hypothetical protein